MVPAPLARPALPRPCLCLVTDRHLAGPALEEHAAQAIEGGVDMVQLREKDMAPGPLISLAAKLRAITRGRALFIVNGALDAALACGADGVHLGEEAVPVHVARRALGEGALIGRSVHGIEAALAAQADGADYLIVGTMFETSSKAGKRPEGPALLREVARRVSVPLLGIGGITPQNAGAVMDAGASGVAVISGILAAPDPAAAAAALAAAMDRVGVRPW